MLNFITFYDMQPDTQNLNEYKELSWTVWNIQGKRGRNLIIFQADNTSQSEKISLA